MTVSKRAAAKRPATDWKSPGSPHELGTAEQLAHAIVTERADLLPSVERIMTAPLDGDGRVRALGLFRPNGNGTKLVSLSTDEDEGVRFAALKLLMSGQYTVPFSLWSPLLSEEGLIDRPISERRAVFQAVRATCGDEAVPYWQGLMTEWAWMNRRKKEELAQKKFKVEKTKHQSRNREASLGVRCKNVFSIECSFQDKKSSRNSQKIGSAFK